MEMIFIDSSNVEQIGFDDQAGEIHVIFKNGRHYIYSPASQEVFDEFRNAPSKGTYLNQVIKPRYSCREV